MKDGFILEQKKKKLKSLDSVFVAFISCKLSEVLLHSVQLL